MLELNISHQSQQHITRVTKEHHLFQYHTLYLYRLLNRDSPSVLSGFINSIYVGQAITQFKFSTSNTHYLKSITFVKDVIILVLRIIVI